MVRITNTIDINASPHQVYSALRALDAYPTWLRHSLVYRGTRMRTPEVGARLTYEDSTMLGRMRGEIVADVPDQVLQFHQRKPSGRLDALIRYDMEAAETSTHLTRVGELTTHGALRLVQPILLRMAGAESERTMKSLKTYVERRK
ncbi:SRPBCC family protein [Microbacterium sp. zg.B48]|uniref:SRPBCC family protein n=1 Tax=unclassified Microbacterium TaxID=2609290 RepID=UPI00214BC82B|nr:MULTISPECIES: SRPBCC family protein [unclassified Microbacterium]MCR2762058.1 SRPBCC family protein [Microbacterium sp. zg.B48]WIM17759.1 SRPBCC family protein [Microbacterium sp. zg-B185]